MERRVKDRLVGAAVWVAAAIILIPAILSGPRRSVEPAVTTHTTPESAGKTVTIDLSRSPGAESVARVDDRAPPPEQAAPHAEVPQTLDAPTATRPATSENQANLHQGTPESTPTRGTVPVEREPVSTATPSTATTRTPTVSVRDTPPPIASNSTIPTSRGWAVQLGSFASRATADRMAQDSSANGQKAFVMPVKSGDTTLYRVRIGPFADRSEANEVLRDVKSRVANAAVVAHP